MIPGAFLLKFVVRVPCSTFALTLNTPVPLLQHKNRHMLSLLDTSPVSNEAEQIAQGPSGEVALGYFISDDRSRAPWLLAVRLSPRTGLRRTVRAPRPDDRRA